MNIPSQAAFLQFDVKKGDWLGNLIKVQDGLARLAPDEGSLVVLPELWSSGYDYQNLADHAERTVELLTAIQEEAGRYKIFLAGSLPEGDMTAGDKKIYNTLFFSSKDGVVGRYRKQHLFAPMGEDHFFSAGQGYQPVSLAAGLVAGLVCYDLRFPDLANIQVGMGAGLLVVVAQWPTVRLEHWRILLQARAIENQVYVVACNRCGESDETQFAGHSMIIAPDGGILAEAGSGPVEKAQPLDLKRILEVRKRFTTVADRPYQLWGAEK